MERRRNHLSCLLRDLNSCIPCRRVGVARIENYGTCTPMCSMGSRYSHGSGTEAVLRKGGSTDTDAICCYKREITPRGIMPKSCAYTSSTYAVSGTDTSLATLKPKRGSRKILGWHSQGCIRHRDVSNQQPLSVLLQKRLRFV